MPLNWKIYLAANGLSCILSPIQASAAQNLRLGPRHFDSTLLGDGGGDNSENVRLFQTFLNSMESVQEA